MLRSAFFATVFSLISGIATAQCTGDSFLNRLTPDDRARVETAAATTPFGHGLTWQAARGDRTLTIIGTMHIPDPRLNDMFARIQPMLANADLLLVEASDVEETQMKSAFANDPSLFMITDGPSLIEQLDPATWDAVAQAARLRQMPPFMVSNFQPWYLTLTLSIPVCALPDLTSGKRGLDHLIMAAATENGTPIQALEPWDTLIKVMRLGSPQEQLDQLKLSLLAPELQSEMFVAMLDAYFTEQIAVLWETSRIAADYVPGLDPETATALFNESEQAILIDRNKSWIPTIESASKSNKNTIIAFGAAHLPGENGVLNLLQQNGWTVTPQP